MESMQNDGNDSEDPTQTFVLDLSGKSVLTVPKSIRKFQNCKSINLSCNNIKSISSNDFNGLPQLKELKLYGNALEGISGLQCLHKLQDLQLQFNRITSIEDSLKMNKGLKSLRIDSNRIRVIKSYEICSLFNLTYLDVSSNSLEDISSFNVLTSLVELHCTHNSLVRIHDLHALKKLIEIDFSHNALIDVSGLKSLPNLKSLNLEHNKLSSVRTLGKIKSLQDLKLCYNCVCDLKHIVEQFPQLENLSVSYNSISKLSQIQHLHQVKCLRELLITGNQVVENVQTKKSSAEILKEIDLDILDGCIIKKVRTLNQQPKVMRPMSANQLVSARLIQDQMSYSEIFLTEFEDKMNLQFTAIHGLLSTLPDEKPNSSSIHSLASKRLSTDRPTSQCSSRARLEDARIFAAEHFIS